MKEYKAILISTASLRNSIDFLKQPSQNKLSKSRFQLALPLSRPIGAGYENKCVPVRSLVGYCAPCHAVLPMAMGTVTNTCVEYH